MWHAVTECQNARMPEPDVPPPARHSLNGYIAYPIYHHLLYLTPIVVSNIVGVYYFLKILNRVQTKA